MLPSLTAMATVISQRRQRVSRQYRFRRWGGITAPMIDTGDIRKGSTFELDGRLLKVIDFSHNKQGRGSAQMRMTLRDLRTGSTTQQTVMAGTRFNAIPVSYTHVQFLYLSLIHISEPTRPY